VNISLRPFGQKEYGTRTEMKNLNSFSGIERAIDYETRRQRSLLESGGAVVQETLRWDDGAGVSISMRDKEEAHDYRYFPDPDLVPVFLEDAEIAGIRAGLPELPGAKKERYMRDLGLSEYDAGVLTSSKYTAALFESCVDLGAPAKAVCNYIMVDLLKMLNESGTDAADIPITPEQLCELLDLVERGKINSSVGKQVFEMMFTTGQSPAQIVEEKGLKQIDDAGEIRALVMKIIEENPKPAADYRGGNAKAMTFFVGQVMRATKGKANPQTVNALVKEELEK
jgi:aspartyl-tRNA(Asn)/glutamyl-tRNA(Gln) amidotransferase subunit B